jgi:glutathione S-transferase
MSELILYIPPGRPWGVPHMSPFCAKLETYLRMTQTPHRVEAAPMTKAPKGKIPFVSIDGELMGDSQLIIDRLERAAAKPLDAGLAPRERAIGRAVRRMLEEGTYFTGVYLRWATDEGYRHVRAELMKMLPGPIKLMMPLIRKKAVKSTMAQGTGRHSFDDICAMAIADFTACADILGDKPYLLGDEPHICDTSLYPFIEGVVRFPNPTPVSKALQNMPTLLAYRDRIRKTWWPELDGATP